MRINGQIKHITQKLHEGVVNNCEQTSC
jgi:hypothetical protein